MSLWDQDVMLVRLTTKQAALVLGVHESTVIRHAAHLDGNQDWGQPGCPWTFDSGLVWKRYYEQRGQTDHPADPADPAG